MKRFWLSVALCTSLLAVGMFCFLPSTTAQNNSNNVSPLPALLSMPAPPPPNPFYRSSLTERDENFYSKKNPPADNAPIEDLLDYWQRQSNGYRELGYNIKLSGKSLDRVLEVIEKKPERLTEFLNALPDDEDTAEFVKRLYDRRQKDDDESSSEWDSAVQRWLTFNSKYFSDSLLQTARTVRDTEEYVSSQDELLALAKVDWEKARPIVERLYTDPQSKTSRVLAQWAYYKHALATDSLGDIERFRDELKAVVEDKAASAGMRDLAFDALVKEKDWNGRDDWYYTLLEDETLAELRINGQLYTGLTTIIFYQPDDKYIEKMLELLKSSSANVRSAAVRNLGLILNTNQNIEILRAMLPWLENPRWAKESNGERSRLVAALRTVVLPESVPGLIAMLNEKEKRAMPTGNYNVNSSMSNTTVASNRIAATNANVARMVDYYPYRSAAITALEAQKSPLAASALRQILNSVETWEKPTVVRAILASNGFSLNEQLEALEAVAKTVPPEEEIVPIDESANMSVSEVETREPEVDVLTIRMTTVNSTSANYDAPLIRRQMNPDDLKSLLGSQMLTLQDPSESLVKAVIDRITFYDKRDPEMAAGLRRIIQNWRGTAINALFLRDLKDGKANATAILRLLILRREMREKQLNDVTAIRAGSQTALGISACLLEQPEDADAILSGGSDEAKTALFACARLIRLPLSVAKSAANLKSPNRLLASAAEKYLESEDSPEARAQVLALHPNEAKILGARGFFSSGAPVVGLNFSGLTRDLFVSVEPSFARFPEYFFYNATDDQDLEKRLRKEAVENQELLGIYAYDDNFVRIYKDKVVFSWEDDPARYRERALSAEEFDALKNLLAANRVDELPPFLSPCESCESKELLMLGRAGGRRVYVRADPLPQFFAELETIFEEFRRPPAQIRYYLEKDVSGLEVLFADENLRAATVWKNGGDLRVLIDDLSLRKQNEKAAAALEEKIISEAEVDDGDGETPESRMNEPEITRRREQLARQREYGSFAWYQLDESKLGAPAGQPEGFWIIPPLDGFAVPPSDRQWKARSGGTEIRTDREALYKIRGGQFTKLRDGFYFDPLVTPNGRWLIVSKYSESEEDYGGGTMRVNLLTNREFRVKMPEDYGAPEPVAVLPSGKVVLFVSYGEGEEGGYDAGERDGEFHLLDPETGLVQPFKGEARPLLQQTFRPLQSVAGTPDAFWAAIPDREANTTRIGVYNARTLAFKPLLSLPRIIFNSMDMWADEGAGKFYFVYEGHLLSLPLPKNK